jgi:hypothetical protein
MFRLQLFLLHYTQSRDVFYHKIKKEDVSKIDVVAENRFNDYRSPLGIGIKKAASFDTASAK